MRLSTLEGNRFLVIGISVVLSCTIRLDAAVPFLLRTVSRQDFVQPKGLQGLLGLVGVNIQANDSILTENHLNIVLDDMEILAD